MEAYFKKETSFSESSIESFLLYKIQSISHSGVNKYIKAFKQYCEFKQLELPKTVTKLKEHPKARILFSDTEIDSFISLDPPPSKYGVFWSILAYTGARPGEIVGLTQADIDPAQHVMYIHKTKTGVPRIIPVVKALQDLLYSYTKIANTNLLFPNEYKRTIPITYAAYMRNFEWRLEKLGIKKRVKPYSLRHSYITNSLGNGASLYAIQDVVGHSDSNTTRKYYHGNIDLMRKAAEKLPIAQKKQDPKALVDQMSDLIDEFFSKDPRYDIEELLEAKKHLYKSIKTDNK